MSSEISSKELNELDYEIYLYDTYFSNIEGLNDIMIYNNKLIFYIKSSNKLKTIVNILENYVKIADIVKMKIKILIDK